MHLNTAVRQRLGSRRISSRITRDGSRLPPDLLPARRAMTDAQLRGIWMLRCALCSHEPRGDERCQRDLNRLGDALEAAFATLRWHHVAPPVFGSCGAIGVTPDEATLLRATSAIQHDLPGESAQLTAQLAGPAASYALGEVVGLLAAILGASGYWLPEPAACDVVAIA